LQPKTCANKKIAVFIAPHPMRNIPPNQLSVDLSDRFVQIATLR